MSREKENFWNKSARSRKYNLVAHTEHYLSDAGGTALKHVCIITQFLFIY